MTLSLRLIGPQIIGLRDILSRAFTPSEFDDFLLAQFDLVREKVTTAASFDAVTREIVVFFNNRSQIPTLLSQARLVRPRDADLAAFIEELGGPTAQPKGLPPLSQLERTIRAANSMLDVRSWTRRLATVQHQVCRIELRLGSAMVFGTGFLVAPDVVLTNYHVVEPLIDGTVAPEALSVRFDYVVEEDGRDRNLGSAFTLASDWLIDWSPYGAAGSDRDPAGDELDYALLRVTGAPGAERIAGAFNRMATFQARGWIAQADSPPPVYQPDAAIYILQHPRGDTLKLALDTSAIIGVNGNGSRLRYRTNTEPGSSGSPCFDSNWNLLAVHQAGDPDFSPGHNPAYNQGVPFAAIRRLLRERSKLNVLGAP